jgi:hypothetical protein|tara:strand:- start:91 stop:279 length:189 start_codon:yes stop_codon:yes gene_type:complete
MNNPEYPFNIEDNDLEDIVSFIVDNNNDDSEIEYLDGVISDLEFIRGLYVLKSEGKDIYATD